MAIMGIRCIEYDHGLKASTTFRNVHCVGRWIQRNIIGLDHTISFNRPVLQIINSLMTRQHTVIFQHLIANSQGTRGAKYSHPVLVTRLSKNFLPDEEFSAFNRVFVAPERITSIIVAFMRFGHLLSNQMISQLSPLLRNSGRRRTSLSSGVSHHPLIHMLSCLLFRKA